MSKRNWFSAFWSAEEIPRSMGLLFVLVYLVALSAVAVNGHKQTYELSQEQRVTQRVNAVEVLTATLAAQGVAKDAAGLNRIVLQVAQAANCRELRFFGRDQMVVASLAGHEIGQPVRSVPDSGAGEPAGITTQMQPAHAGVATLVVRAPVGSAPDGLFVEAVFDVESVTLVQSLLHPWTLVMALACTGALLLMYRRMRRHFHNTSWIADSLVHHADDLRAALPSLRLSGSDDKVCESWNRLIDLVSELDIEVARSDAAKELMAVLSRTQKGELSEAMHSAPLGAMLVDQSERVLYSNAMASRLLGWQDADGELQSLDVADRSEDARHFVSYIRACITTGAPTRAVDRQIEVGDGSFYNVQVTPARAVQQAGRYVVIILDISQQVRADRAAEEFVSNVTHELRTPLTNIQAYTETLTSGVFDDPQVITNCYNVITKETRRLSRLIEDILSVSQLEVGTMQLVMDRVDLRAVLTEAVRDLRGLAESKEIDLQIKLPAKLDPIRADRDKLNVVINNLLGNAIKYTPSGGHVTVNCQAADNEVHVSVRDDGIGIAADDHARIFEKFQRSTDEAVQSETGTGIGLTTAREIAQHHGGSIELVSDKGKGSTFTLKLPVEKRVAVGAA